MTIATDQEGLISRLAATPDRVRELALRAPAPTAGARRGQPNAEEPEAGDWSAREVVLHLIAVEKAVWQRRLADLQLRDEPRWGWTEPGVWSGAGDETFGSAAAVFTGCRAATVATIRSLDDSVWARHGVHATFGRLDLGALLQVAIDHDDEHLRQIEAAP
jgi:DinB superfamily